MKPETGLSLQTPARPALAEQGGQQMRSVTRTGRGTTATEPGPCLAVGDRRVALGLLGTAATAGIASWLHLRGRIPLSFSTPAPTTPGLRITEVTYPGGTEHVRAVRADLRAALHDCPRADEVILCASELAANAAQPSRSGLPAGELGVLFDQSPIAMVFTDRDLRTRRTNAAFRRLAGLPDEALTGRRPSEAGHGDRITDTALIERHLAEEVIDGDVPVVSMHLEQTLAGERRVLSWSAYRVTDNGHVLGAVSCLTDITGRVRAVTALQQAYARLDLLERAGSQIGTTLDIRRTAGELADLAVPDLADRVAVDLCDQVLQGEDPCQDPRAGLGTLRFRRDLR